MALPLPRVGDDMASEPSAEFVALKLVISALLAGLDAVDHHIASSIANRLRERVPDYGDPEVTRLVDGILQHIDTPTEARTRFGVIVGGKIADPNSGGS